MNFKSLFQNRSTKLIAISGLAVVAWFALAEVTTEAWYRYKESQVPETQPWNIQFPDPADPMAAAEKGFFNFESREMGEQEQEILRFRDGIGYNWKDEQENSWTAFFLGWDLDPRLNNNDIHHNPTICLPAAGLTLEETLPDTTVETPAGEFVFRSWEFSAGSMPVFVFTAVRRAYEQQIEEYVSDNASALGKRGAMIQRVFDGNRTNPLQTLQLVVTGPETVEEAREYLKVLLQELVAQPAEPAPSA